MESSITHQTHHRIWLLVILTLFGISALVYSLLLPLGEAADEFEHFALIRFISEEQRLPLTQKEQLSIGSKGDASPIYHSLVAVLTQHVDVSALPELSNPRHKIERAISGDRLPFTGLYHIEDEYYPFRGIVLAWHLARLVSIPLGILTLFAIYLTISAIYPNRPYFALGAIAFVAFIPRFLINSAIISDDNLVIPLMAFAIYFLVKISQGNTESRELIYLGIFAGLAAISKYHSLLLLPLITIMLIFLIRQKGWTWQTGLRYWAIVMATFVLVAGWWFAFLVIQFNQIEQLGWLRGLVAPLGDPVIASSVERLFEAQSNTNLGYENQLNGFAWINQLFKTFWFRYGRGNIINEPIINWTLFVIVLIAVMGISLSLWQNRREINGKLFSIRSWRLDVMVLALLILVYFGLVAVRYLTVPTRETAQGRHLYPTLIALAFFFTVGITQFLTYLRLHLKRDLLAMCVIGLIFFGFSGIALTQVIIPHYYPYLPIRRVNLHGTSIQYPQNITLADGINFKGYGLGDQKVNEDNTLLVSLYWQTTTAVERDYFIKLCLHEVGGSPISCWQGHPVNGRYPTRAWEKDYLIRDDVFLPLPYCLPADDYTLKLSAYPLRLDTASTVIDDESMSTTVTLGQVSTTNRQNNSASDVEIWSANKRFIDGQIEIEQLRQSFTVIHQSLDGHDEVWFQPTISDLTDARWTPVSEPTHYTCSDGDIISTYSFIADQSIVPTTYRLRINDKTDNNLLVKVNTRSRRYETPRTLSNSNLIQFGDEIELLGYNADLSPRWPGDTVEIEVFWKTLRTMKQRYVGSIHLVDYKIDMLGQIDQVLGGDFEYPNILWAPGEVIRETYQLPIDQNAAPGLYTLEFGVYNNNFGSFDFLPIDTLNTDSSETTTQLKLGQLRILDPARLQTPAVPMQVRVGDEFQLLGFDLDTLQLEPNQSIHLAVYWQATAKAQVDYTVFTQLIGPDGKVWGQQDNQPQGGRYPTTLWIVEDRVIDRYELSVGEDAPLGDYQLLVGMYNLQNGQRLPAVSLDGNPLPSDAIPLTTLSLKLKAE